MHRNRPTRSSPYVDPATAATPNLGGGADVARAAVDHGSTTNPHEDRGGL